MARSENIRVSKNFKDYINEQAKRLKKETGINLTIPELTEYICKTMKDIGLMDLSKGKTKKI